MSGAVIAQVGNNVSKLVRFLETVAGRDKIVRLFQYSSKFLAWWLVNNNRLDSSKKFSSVESSASIARKVFRLLKSLGHLQTAKSSWEKEKDLVVKFTTVAQNLFLAAWLYYDHILLFNKIGLISRDTKPVSKKSNTFWLLAMIMAIVRAAYYIHDTQNTARNATKPETLESIRQRQTEYSLELVKNVIDLPIPLSGLSPRFASVFPSGLVGLCGTVSSFIGVHQVWGKIK
eukprot:TRINITY_DN12977_c0_g1_i1.p1 TRINITY_DN12977_c0_g1~~TRINITY_DN12977_c0_g1_i1.p1  ORF type:complete len:264 (+),score=71.25 TRINITY_DN12977_c0_g1_i1:101-793(+)